MKRKLSVLFIALLALFALAACGSEDEKTAAEVKEVKIGVNGADQEVWKVFKEKAAKEDIKVEIVNFQDYTLPNKALTDGDIDMNSFQHLAFLSSYVKENAADISTIGASLVAPIGVYSEKIKSLDELKKGDKIAIPNDTANMARSLKLLESQGVIELADNFGYFGDPSKITKNPKNIEILEVDAQQTPRVLKDVAASFINSGVAGQAGFDPVNDPIFVEDKDSEGIEPYINIFAVRTADKDDETLNKLVEIYHSDEIAAAVKKDTNGGSIVIDTQLEKVQKIYDDLKDAQ